METIAGERSQAPDQGKGVSVEPAAPYVLTRKGQTWDGAQLPAISRPPSCPKCSNQEFGIVDVDPDGDYPSIRYLCLYCRTVWVETQLRGIEWVMPVGTDE